MALTFSLEWTPGAMTSASMMTAKATASGNFSSGGEGRGKGQGISVQRLKVSLLLALARFRQDGLARYLSANEYYVYTVPESQFLQRLLH